MNDFNPGINVSIALKSFYIHALSVCGPLNRPNQRLVCSYYKTRTLLATAMAIDDLVLDPALRKLLSYSGTSLAYALDMVNWVDANQSEDPPSDARLKLSQLQKTVIASLAQLRAQNKHSITCVRETKRATAEARQEVDRLFLQLQNLYYEQRHLMGEISACESYE